VLAVAFGPRDLDRVYTSLNIWDFNVYLGAMRDAAKGSWLVYNHYAIEPHQPRLIHLPYVAVGQLARLLHAEPLQIYWLVEQLGRSAVVIATLGFTRAFLPAGGRARRLAVLLALFESGLSFWLALGAMATGLPIWPEEGLYYETNTLAVLFSGIHLMFGLGLTLAVIGRFFEADQSGFTPRAAGWLVAATVLLSLVHPYNVPAVLTAFGLYLAVRLVQERRMPWPGVAAAVAIALAAAPLLVGDFVTFVLDPTWSGSYLEQKIVQSPRGLALVAHFGLPLLLAAFGLAVWREGGRRRLLVAMLIVAGLAWMNAPVGLQRRFAFALPHFMAIPAAVGVDWLMSHVPAPAHVWRRVTVYGLTLGASATAIAMYVAILSSAAVGWPYPSYPSTAAEARAARWLAERTDEQDVVLSGVESGYLLGAHLPGRVVVGHTHETPDFHRKHEAVKHFFSPTTAAADRLEIATTLRVTHVFYGPLERALGPPPEMPRLEVIYQQDGVSIYRLGHG
jgi:hypothetical protein